MSTTLTYGLKRPDTGDPGSSWFSDLEDNITRLDAHDHDGSDSAQLTNSAIASNAAIAWSKIDDLPYESSPSSPAANYVKLFVQSDNKLYTKTSGGLEQAVGGGGGGSFVWSLPDSSAAIATNTGGVDVFDFDYQSSQSIYAIFKVPDNYSAGVQIVIRGALYSCSATSGNVLFQVTTSLIEPGSTVLGTYSNQHTSTNTENTVEAVASTLQAIGDIDITDSSGQINSTAVAAGDLLLIQLTRAIGSESSSAAADARFIKFSAEIISS